MTQETDRELLELAAKAAGITWTRDYKDGPMNVMMPFTRAWDPLTDDGDALRLAVKLGLQIVHYSVTSSGTDRVGAGSPGKMEAYHTNPNAATRRAIVRAAAEIGKTK